MDIISLNKANQTLKTIKQLDEEVVAPFAEDRFPTVDARLDWLEGQAAKVKVQNSKIVDLSQGLFTNTEFTNGKVQLKLVKNNENSGYTSNVIPAMTSNNSPSGIASASSISGVANDAWKAFDKDNTTAWSTPMGTTTGWLQYEFPTPRKITKYAIRIRASARPVIRAPKNWTFEGWNEVTKSWDILDSKSNITNWIAGELKQFEINNVNYYKKYRINVSQNNGDNYLQIGEFEMMESAAQNQYSSSGIWESPIIDLGEGWKETKLVDIVKQIHIGITNVSFEIATSTDGVSFTSYVSLDPNALPQARYIKLRATLSAQAQPGQTKTLDFNQSSSENMMTLNEYTEANGKLQLKNTYTYSMTDDGTLGSGKQFSVTLNKTNFKSINSLEVQ